MKPLIRLKVIGYNLDQLINKLYSKQIVCYNIEKPETNVVLFSIHPKDFSKVKSMLKNYEHHIQYLGIANVKQFLLKNLSIIIMIPFAIMLMAISSQFTWNIKVYGGEEGLDKSVISILKNNNIAVGKIVKENCGEIEQILLDKLPNVAQVSCIKRGTTLIINISKKLVYTPDTYEPIRAKYSGVIEGFSLISGTIAVDCGDFVSAGDILVYPFTIDKDGHQVQVEPIAQIWAKAYVIGSAKLNATTLELARTGREYTTSSIHFLNKNLFSKKLPKPFDIYESSVYNQYISRVLPIVKTTVTYYELDYVVVSHDLLTEQACVEQESKDIAYQNLPTNSEILDEQTSSVIVNDCLYSTTTLTISTIIS